jgi:hypothetical protein
MIARGIDQSLGRRSFRDMDHAAAYSTLRNRLGDRPYLSDILERFGKKYALPFARIVEIVANAPAQEAVGR